MANVKMDQKTSQVLNKPSIVECNNALNAKIFSTNNLNDENSHPIDACSSQKMVCDVKMAEDFVAKAEQFIKEFDVLYEDHMNGLKLDSLCEAFISQHSDVLKSFETCVQIIDKATNKDVTKYPDGNLNDIIAEDVKIVLDDPSVVYTKTNYSELLCGLCWRFTGAKYLKITQDLSEGKEVDRKLPSDLARRAFRMNPNDHLSNVWMMLTCGFFIENMQVSRTQALGAQLVRELIERVIKMDTSYFLGYHMLGRYLCTQSQMSWVERSLAKAFTNVKMDGTFDKAEAALLQSNKLRPNWVPNGYWLARVKVGQKRPLQDVKPWIDMGLSNKVTEPFGAIERNELLKLKEKLKL